VGLKNEIEENYYSYQSKKRKLLENKISEDIPEEMEKDQIREGIRPS
jgi:hypothetical protein